MTQLDDRAAHWFEKRRGIRRETVDAFGIYTEGRDLVIPYPEGLLKRRYSTDEDNPFGLDKEGRRFVWRDAQGGPAGAGQVPFLPPDFAQAERMILVEGETDTMALWQALPASLRSKVTVVGISGVGSWKDRYAEELFASATRVFVVLDNDDPYESPDAVKSVEGGWRKIRAALGKKARRVKLPQGVEDVAAFFMAYDWPAFEVLLKAAGAPKRHYPRLDLFQPVPDTDWVVEDLLVAEEATVLVGDGGVGKSWFTMGLALAVAGDAETFLGQAIKKHGPVLYVDEESSKALALQRLHALGLGEKHKETLEYLWYAGVDLGREPQLLLDDAMEIEPALVIVDSLSRVALGLDENSNKEMTELIRGGLVPLARDTGAAVLFVHHSSKDGKTDVRGATQIRNAADNALAMSKEEAGSMIWERVRIFPSKPRRELVTLTMSIEGSMKDDGFVNLVNPVAEAF